MEIRLLVRFPDGTTVRALPLARRDIDDEWRDYGLYCDAAWAPSWPAEIIDWPDFGVPADSVVAAEQIRRVFSRAQEGQRIEIGCLAGLGRTGTVLACMAVLAGISAEDAVGWVREIYDPDAVETPEQERWVLWFADHIAIESR